MERLQNETIEDLETRLWAEHKQQSAAARAATSIAFIVEGNRVVGGAVVSNYNQLPEGFVAWCDLSHQAIIR